MQLRSPSYPRAVGVAAEAFGEGCFGGGGVVACDPCTDESSDARGARGSAPSRGA